MNPLSHHLLHRCIKLQFGGEETQNEAWSWLADNQLSSVVNTKESRFDLFVFPPLKNSELQLINSLCQISATDEAWRLLASYLDSYPSTNAQYHRCVINKLLSHGVPLPDWLVRSYKVRRLTI